MIYPVKTPVPGPSSTIEEDFSRFIPAVIVLASTGELGQTDPTADGDFIKFFNNRNPDIS
jgi:hypothetical protein